jgi:hypothetical protein
MPSRISTPRKTTISLARRWLHPDRFDPPDVFRRKDELFGFEVFFHMLGICRSGQRQHPDLHGKPKDDLCDARPCTLGNGPYFGIGPHVAIGRQERKPLINDAVGAANLPNLLIPSERGITPILHDHGFHRGLCTQLGDLFGGDVADADHFGFSRSIESFHGRPHFPIRCAQPSARIGSVQDIRVDIVGVEMGQRALEGLRHLRRQIGRGVVWGE